MSRDPVSGVDVLVWTHLYASLTAALTTAAGRALARVRRAAGADVAGYGVPPPR